MVDIKQYNKIIISRCLAAVDPGGSGSNVCEWTYNGQGIEYQVLAGPVFVVVFTISGIIMGFLADKFSRFEIKDTLNKKIYL